jgi:hypothetical protein
VNLSIFKWWKQTCVTKGRRKEKMFGKIMHGEAKSGRLKYPKRVGKEVK